MSFLPWWSAVYELTMPQYEKVRFIGYAVPTTPADIVALNDPKPLQTHPKWLKTARKWFL